MRRQIFIGKIHGKTQSNILDTEVRTAERVAEIIFERNLAQVDAPQPDDINAWLRAMLYKPEYRSFAVSS